MAKRRTYTCIVCGRKFYEGQGIVIKRAGLELTFHSKSCLTKFFKRFIEVIDEREFKRATKEIEKEFEELLKSRSRVKII